MNKNIWKILPKKAQGLHSQISTHDKNSLSIDKKDETFISDDKKGHNNNESVSIPTEEFLTEEEYLKEQNSNTKNSSYDRYKESHDRKSFTSTFYESMKSIGVKQFIKMLRPSFSTFIMIVLVILSAFFFPQEGWDFIEGNNSVSNDLEKEKDYKSPSQAPTPPDSKTTESEMTESSVESKTPEASTETYTPETSNNELPQTEDNSQYSENQNIDPYDNQYQGSNGYQNPPVAKNTTSTTTYPSTSSQQNAPKTTSETAAPTSQNNMGILSP